MKKTRMSVRQSKGFLRVIFFLGIVGMLVMPGMAYAEDCHHLSVSAGEGGLVETTPANTYEFCNYGYGWKDVTIRAYPNPRYERLGKKYEFVRFDIAEYDDNGNVSEEHTSDSSELTLTMDRDYAVAAIFEEVLLDKAGDEGYDLFSTKDYDTYKEEAEGEERIENVTIEGVTIKDHSGKAENGPIQNHAKNLKLSDCKVVDNKGLRASAVYTGYNSNLNLDNTLIANNTNTGEKIEEPDRIPLWRRRFAGAVYLGGRAALNMTNSTVAGNTNESETSNKAVSYGAVQRSWLNDVNIEDSIMWDNEGGNDVSSMIKWLQKRYIINSNIQQKDIPGMGSLREVISVDPEFKDPASSDYDVSINSPLRIGIM